MEKIKPKFGQRIPELNDVIMKYGCSINDKPEFVIIGQYKSDVIGLVQGIIATAKNEFYAYLLRREINKNGICEIQRSEFHPSGTGTFSVTEHAQKIREHFSKKKEIV